MVDSDSFLSESDRDDSVLVLLMLVSLFLDEQLKLLDAELLACSLAFSSGAVSTRGILSRDRDRALVLATDIADCAVGNNGTTKLSTLFALLSCAGKQIIPFKKRNKQSIQ